MDHLNVEELMLAEHTHFHVRYWKVLVASVAIISICASSNTAYPQQQSEDREALNAIQFRITECNPRGLSPSYRRITGDAPPELSLYVEDIARAALSRAEQIVWAQCPVRNVFRTGPDLTNIVVEIFQAGVRVIRARSYPGSNGQPNWQEYDNVAGRYHSQRLEAARHQRVVEEKREKAIGVTAARPTETPTSSTSVISNNPSDAAMILVLLILSGGLILIAFRFIVASASSINDSAIASFRRVTLFFKMKRPTSLQDRGEFFVTKDRVSSTIHRARKRAETERKWIENDIQRRRTENERIKREFVEGRPKNGR